MLYKQLFSVGIVLFGSIGTSNAIQCGTNIAEMSKPQYFVNNTCVNFLEALGEEPEDDEPAIYADSVCLNNKQSLVRLYRGSTCDRASLNSVMAVNGRDMEQDGQKLSAICDDNCQFERNPECDLNGFGMPFTPTMRLAPLACNQIDAGMSEQLQCRCDNVGVIKVYTSNDCTGHLYSVRFLAPNETDYKNYAINKCMYPQCGSNSTDLLQIGVTLVTKEGGPTFIPINKCINGFKSFCNREKTMGSLLHYSSNDCTGIPQLNQTIQNGQTTNLFGGTMNATMKCDDSIQCLPPRKFLPSDLL
jgi:hypothetical protein